MKVTFFNPFYYSLHEPEPLNYFSGFGIGAGQPEKDKLYVKLSQEFADLNQHRSGDSGMELADSLCRTFANWWYGIQENPRKLTIEDFEQINIEDLLEEMTFLGKEEKDALRKAFTGLKRIQDIVRELTGQNIDLDFK